MAFPIRQIDEQGKPGHEIRIGICEDCSKNIEKYGSAK